MSHDIYPRQHKVEGDAVPAPEIQGTETYKIPTQGPPPRQEGGYSQQPVDDIETRKAKKKRALKVGGVAAVLTGLAAGIAVEMGISHSQSVGASSPETSNSAAPMPGSSSTEATPVAPKEDLSKNVTAKTYGFEFIGDADVSGKYVGDTAAIKALSVQGDYTPIQSLDKLIDRFNMEANYGTDPSLQSKEDERRYETADEEQTGIGAITKDFVYPVFKAALTDPKVAKEQGTSIDDFLSHTEELNYNNIGNAATVINVKSSPPFASKLQIENETLQASVSDGKGHTISQISGELVFDDNVNDPNGLNQLSQNRAKPGGFNKVVTPQYHEQYHVTFTESTDENHVTKLIGGRYDDIGN